MKTQKQRQEYLLANPVGKFEDLEKFHAVMFALILSDLFGVNDWRNVTEPKRSKLVAETCQTILNRSAGIVWC